MVSFLLLSACNPIVGILDINQNMNFKVVDEDARTCNPMGGAGTDACDEDDDDMSTNPTYKIITMRPSAYETKLDYQSKRQLVLKIKTSRRKTQEVEINVPNSRELPRNGTISIPSRTSGQPWDARGPIHTEVTNSEEYTEHERCSYTRSRTVCTGGGRYRTCHQVSETVWGNRWVGFYYRNTKTDLALEFFKPGTEDSMANFNGTRDITKKIYTFQGICR